MPCDDDFDDIDVYLAETEVVEADPLPPPASDHDDLRTKLKAKFPGADPQFVSRLLGSKLHTEAFLSDKPDKRADDLLHKFASQNGRASSSDLKRWGVRNSGGAVMAAIRDAGLFIDKSSGFSGKSGNLYEVNLRAFGRNRGARNSLSNSDKKRLLQLYNDRCNLCGSPGDLQFDHRIGVRLGGGGHAQKHGLAAWQPLCRRCNNDKENACENQCKYAKAAATASPEELNGLILKCQECSWASPEDHTHTAGVPGARFSGLFPSELLNEARAVGGPAKYIESLLRHLVRKKSNGAG